MKQFTNKLTEQGVGKKSQFISFMLLTFLMLTFQVNAQTVETFTTTGTFTVPAGVTTVQVEAWAGGGSGGGATGNPSGGGGGAGGNYVKSTSLSVPLSSYTVTVGLGANGTNGAGTTGNSSWFGTTGTILATGGLGGSLSSTNSSSAAGATAITTGCIGTTINKGGNGGTGATGATGGGGGSSASTISALANNGGVTNGGAAPTGGGAGGNAGLTSGNGGAGNPGVFPGGGGGGGRAGSNSDRSGADGGDGQVKVTYTCPTYALTAATTSNGPLCGVGTSVVTLKSTSMGSGTYTITYNLTGNTTATASTATMTFTAGSPGTGTFTTSSISVGTTTVTITKLTSAGCNNTISSNNTASIVVNAAATAVSGTNIATCSTAGTVNITAGSNATNNTGILWTSNGTGSFTNPTSLTTCTYAPSPADIAAGSRTLTLTATGNSPCVNVISNKTITINTAATVDAGTAIITCSSAGAINITAGATATNQANVTWTRSGTGTLTNATSLTTCTYTPSVADITAGTVTLTLTAVANSGCTNVLDTKVLTITTAATAVSGTAIITCSTSGEVNITTGSSATNNAGIIWTSNGTGSFTNPTSLTTCTYTPSAGDITAGSVTMTLTATGNSPCANATSSKLLSISTPPVTVTTTICQGGSGNLTSSTNCGTASPVNVGPVNAGTGANINTVGSVAWTSFGNITAVGSPYASVATVNTSAITNYIQGTNYNFAIPTNAVINGITVVINRQSSGTTAPFLQDNRVSLVKSGTVQTTNKAATGVNWPNNSTAGAALATATYGSIADLWGTTWTATDINNANFGVVLSAVNASTANTRTATVDYMQIRVNYTDPITMNWYTVSSGGTAIGSGNSFNPVGIAGSGLADTNTPGTTTFYAACSTNTECRTATDFVINPNITPTFTAVDPICAGGILSALPLTSNNGITGTWSPALDNMATTTYTFTPTAGLCATTAPLTITVNPNVTPTFTAVAPICVGGILSALPIISNNFITGTWSPALDNMATTTYTFTPDSGQCAITTTLEITVNPIVTPTFTAVFPICAGTIVAALPIISNNFITGTWSPALDNMATTTYTFTPTLGECATSTTLEIIVNDNVLPLFDAVAPICTGTSLSALPTTSNNGIMGTWSPALNNSATTTYTFTPNPGRCSLTTTLEIVVDTNTTTFYADVDGDGYGDAASTVSVCSGQPTGYVSNNTDCLDTNAEVNPNHVEVLGNSIDDNCSGIADEVGPTAKVITSQCGITLVSLWNSIFSTTVATATAYRFEVSNGAFVRTFDTALNRFNLYSISGIAFGTTYSIRVSTKIGGFWQAYGTSCNITTPAFPPTTNVIPSQCGMTITNFWNTIFVNQLTEATGYLIELTDAVNGVRNYAIPNGRNRFNLRDFVGGAVANTVYTVRVAIRYNGVFQGFGSPCTISTSAGAVRESESSSSDMFTVNAFPNPFADNFKLDIETSNENSIEVKVYDMMGRVIESRWVKTTDLNSLEIGANYSSGVYNMIVTQGENIKTLRVIKR